MSGMGRREFMALLGSAAAAWPLAARAQTYPSRPITMIVPFATGGPTDTISRLIAEGMRPSLGQPVIIENVSGAYKLITLAYTFKTLTDEDRRACSSTPGGSSVPTSALKAAAG